MSGSDPHIHRLSEDMMDGRVTPLMRRPGHDEERMSPASVLADRIPDFFASGPGSCSRFLPRFLGRGFLLAGFLVALDLSLDFIPI
jgi:hypothetical protein